MSSAGVLSRFSNFTVPVYVTPRTSAGTATCALAAALALGATSVSAFGPGGPTGPAGAATESDASKGEELFGRNCQQCHNSRGKGGKGPQLVKGAWGPGGANSDGSMFGIVSNGRSGTQMGGFGMALKQDEIWQIIAFLRAEAQRVRRAETASKSADDEPW